MHNCKIRILEVFAQGGEIYRKCFLFLVALSAIGSGSGIFLEHFLGRSYLLQVLTAGIDFWISITSIRLCLRFLEEKAPPKSFQAIVAMPWGKFFRAFVNGVLAYLLSFALPFIVLLSAPVYLRMTSNPVTAMLGGIIFLVLAAALIPFSVWLSIRLSLADVVALAESTDQGWWTVKRSWKLMRPPHAWQGFLLALIILMVMAPGMALFIMAHTYIATGHPQVANGWLYVLGVLGMILAAPLITTTKAAFYKTLCNEEQTA